MNFRNRPTRSRAVPVSPPSDLPGPVTISGVDVLNTKELVEVLLEATRAGTLTWSGEEWGTVVAQDDYGVEIASSLTSGPRYALRVAGLKVHTGQGLAKSLHSVAERSVGERGRQRKVKEAADDIMKKRGDALMPDSALPSEAGLEALIERCLAWGLRGEAQGSERKCGG